jgi:hypothetical protein
MGRILQVGQSVWCSSHRHWRRHLAVLILLSTPVLIPFGVSTSGAATFRVGLCSVQTQVTALRVSRGVPDNPETFTFPRLVFVNREVSAQSVAAALCALPAPPLNAILSCVFDDGFDYSLLFTAPGAEVTDVRLDPTGCEQVSGLGTERWVEQTPGFRRVLGSAMKLKNATYATFAGKMQ